MKIQLKRSNQLEFSKAKQPTSDQMEYGELAVNYNTDDPAIFIKDSSDGIIRIAGVGATGQPDWGDGDGDTYDSRYVKVVGDNMTGDLTLGTDKIVLDATGGDGTFGGRISAGTSIYSQAPNSSAYSIQAKDANGDPYFAVRSTGANNGELIVGGTIAPYAPNVEIKRNGSGTFTNRVTAPSLYAGASDHYFCMEKYQQGSIGSADGAGLFRLNDPDSTHGEQQAIRITQGGNQPNDATVALHYDGSAMFAGKVTSASTESGDSGTTLATKDYVDANSGGDTDNFVTLDTTQSISGQKTFNEFIKVPGGKGLESSGNVSFHSKHSSGNYNFQNTAGNITGALTFNDLTANRGYRFPDKGGTIALTDDIPNTSNFVTLDTAQTIAGQKTFNEFIKVAGQKGIEGNGELRLKSGGSNGIYITSGGAMTLQPGNGKQIQFKTDNPNGDYRFFAPDGTIYANLRFNTLTSNRNYTFPDTAGTIALTSDLFSGSYNDLSDKPSLFSGSYNDLTNKPTIGNGTITIVQPGTADQTFTVNQSGATTITLKNDNSNTTYSAGTDLTLNGTQFNVTSATGNTADQLVKRNGSGGFDAGVIQCTGYSLANLAQL